MKGILVAFLSLMLCMGVSAQVFNNAKILKPGTFSAGLEPALLIKSGSDFVLVGHLGYGLTEGMDISIQASAFGRDTYYGASMQVALMEYFSIAAGAHVWGDFGLDATFLGSYELAHDVDLYGGADMDLNFGGKTYMNLWVPIGIQVSLNNSMAIFLETALGLNGSAPHIIGGGIQVYF